MIKASDQDKEVDIIIKCSNGLNVEYNDIPSPEDFILNLIDEKYDLPKSEGLSLLSSQINSIHIKKKGDNNGFYKIWNSSIFKDYPFNNNKNQNFITFLLIEKKFTRTYLSMYYPFKYGFILDYWDCLALGDAYYSVYINDTEEILDSHFGLSYNKNIRWNSKLKAKYDYGFFNPFTGEYEGILYCQYNDNKISMNIDNHFDFLLSSYSSHEIDYMDIMIPMSAKQEIERRNNNRYLWYNSNRNITVFDSEEYYDEKQLFAHIPKLNF